MGTIFLNILRLPRVCSDPRVLSEAAAVAQNGGGQLAQHQLQPEMLEVGKKETWVMVEGVGEGERKLVVEVEGGGLKRPEGVGSLLMEGVGY